MMLHIYSPNLIGKELKAARLYMYNSIWWYIEAQLLGPTVKENCCENQQGHREDSERCGLAIVA